MIKRTVERERERSLNKQSEEELEHDLNGALNEEIPRMLHSNEAAGANGKEKRQ